MNFATWTRMLMREMMDSSTAGQPPLTAGLFVVSLSCSCNMFYLGDPLTPEKIPVKQ